MFRVFMIIVFLSYALLAEEKKSNEIVVESITELSEGVDQILSAHLGVRRFDFKVKLKNPTERFYCSLISFKYKGNGKYEQEVLFKKQLRAPTNSLIETFELRILLDEEKVTVLNQILGEKTGFGAGTSMRKYKIRGKELIDYSISYPAGWYKNQGHILLSESSIEKHYSFIALVLNKQESRNMDVDFSHLDFSN